MDLQFSLQIISRELIKVGNGVFYNRIKRGWSETYLQFGSIR